MKNMGKGLTGLLIIMIGTFVLFFIGNGIPGNGEKLCSVVLGCVFIILGSWVIFLEMVLKVFGIRISANVISRHSILENHYVDICEINYQIDGEDYKSEIEINKFSKDRQEIPIIVLKKYPTIVMEDKKSWLAF